PPQGAPGGGGGFPSLRPAAAPRLPLSAAHRPGARLRRRQGLSPIRKERPMSHAISRRRFVTAAGTFGLATALAPRAARAQTVVRFSGWAFEPQVVEANVKRFMEQNPDVKVEYTPLDLQLYNEKMV